MCLVSFCLAQKPALGGPDDEPNLTEGQKQQFLLDAKVVASKQLGKGITHPWRLTLSDGQLTHDAAFQSIDEHKSQMRFDDGRTELNFVDSYQPHQRSDHRRLEDLEDRLHPRLPAAARLTGPEGSGDVRPAVAGEVAPVGW
jgi:hypothetical protein